MDPDSKVFKPRYSLRTRALCAFLPALFSVLVCAAVFALTSRPAVFWSAALVLGISTSMVPFYTMREIRFLDELVVRRHFLPDLFFPMDEIEQVGPAKMVTKRGHVRLGELDNLGELKEKYRQWVAAKLLKAARQPQKPRMDYFPQRGYGAYASFWGLVLGVILMMMAPAWLAPDPRWLLAGSFLLVYLLYLYIVPRVL